MKVMITKEAIQAAQQRNSSHCMIADAIKAQYPHLTRISVDIQTIRFTDLHKGERYIHLTPRVAQEGVVKFDQGVPQEAFSFILPKNPSQIIQAGANSKSKSKRKVRDTARAREGSRPTVQGGKPPPRASGFGAVRQFGVRALKI